MSIPWGKILSTLADVAQVAVDKIKAKAEALDPLVRQDQEDTLNAKARARVRTQGAKK